MNTIRTIVMIVCLLCFLGFCFWAYSKRSKAGFDEAAQLPLTDDDLPASPDKKE
ncbi:MAG: cbb3-type cytochrome c oxidase subunit 3 [Azoarcus sp.]|jgi:cytochrome c oxidase cbb3-type subunit 4|nr:cbb3-type cytochrome c oxidase subunit 3 [Azoarcus sp.]